MKKIFRSLPYIFILVFIDQASKLLVKNYFLVSKTLIKVTSFFKIVLIYNTGVSFGILNNWRYSPYVFTIITIVAIFIFLLWLKNNKSAKMIDYGLIMIISGGLGNLLDRLYHGAVIDFLYFHYDDLYWPAFNFADSIITIGVFFIIFDGVFNPKYG